ncbi:MAG: hypothetical protein N2D54_09680 [Chloroflexota bacterium]
MDLYISWVLLWGILPGLAFPNLNISLTILIFALFDILLMPALNPVLILGNGWSWGELLGLLIVLLPSILLSRWTVIDVNLNLRVALITIAYGLTMFWLLPSLIIELTGENWGELLLTQT